jgi:integrase
MARYTVQTPTGPKRKTLYGKTRREVDEKLTAAKADRDGGLVFAADSLKLGDYLVRWLTDSVRDTVRPTTFERYEQMVRLHIRPVLGQLKLKNLTSAHVRGLYRQKLDAGLSFAASNTCTSLFTRLSSKPSPTASSRATPPRPSNRRR